MRHCHLQPEDVKWARKWCLDTWDFSNDLNVLLWSCTDRARRAVAFCFKFSNLNSLLQSYINLLISFSDRTFQRVKLFKHRLKSLYWIFAVSGWSLCDISRHLVFHWWCSARPSLRSVLQMMSPLAVGAFCLQSGLKQWKFGWGETWWNVCCLAWKSALLLWFYF